MLLSDRRTYDSFMGQFDPQPGSAFSHRVSSTNQRPRRDRNVINTSRGLSYRLRDNIRELHGADRGGSVVSAAETRRPDRYERRNNVHQSANSETMNGRHRVSSSNSARYSGSVTSPAHDITSSQPPTPRHQVTTTDLSLCSV